MATGIVAIANDLVGSSYFALGLTWFNVVAYCILWILLLVRIGRYRGEVVKDLADHNRGIGFFSMIAGTNVLGSQIIAIVGESRTTTALWVLGIALWVLLIYVVFTALTIKDAKPSLEKGINGGWLLAVVATQSVSILTTTLSNTLGLNEESMLFAALCFWVFGGMLYIWLISLIFYRYTFFPLSPQALMPPYWINMGAMAISTLAGATLILRADANPFLQELIPFLKGFTILYWATATWWIPMLLLLGFWRHVYKRYVLIYDPLYWGAVFPLGMYTACTFRLGQAIDQSSLFAIAHSFIYVADVAWIATFVGMLYTIFHLLRPAKAPEAAPGAPPG